MTLALVPSAPRHAHARADLPAYDSLIDRLHAARAMCAGGPQVLDLINELFLLCEEILDFAESPDARQPGSACCPAAERFLAELLRHAERIRAGSGELDDAFFELVKTLPETIRDHAA